MKSNVDKHYNYLLDLKNSLTIEEHSFSIIPVTISVFG